MNNFREDLQILAKRLKMSKPTISNLTLIGEVNLSNRKAEDIFYDWAEELFAGDEDYEVDSDYKTIGSCTIYYYKFMCVDLKTVDVDAVEMYFIGTEDSVSITVTFS